MARQRGHIKYQGTIGDIRHFKIKGMDGYYAGLKGGPTANQIKNAPEFARTRENMSEFGGAAKIAKVLRTGLGKSGKTFTDPSFTGRLTALMKQINLKDATGVRGKRAFRLSEHKEALKSIVFKKGVSVDSIINTSVITETNGGSIDITFTALPEPPAAPASATHYRIVYSFACVADYTYNEESKTYEPLASITHGNSATIYSDYFSVNEGHDGSIQTDPARHAEVIPDQNATTAIAIGIEFYIKNNENYLPIAGGAMKIAAVL